MTPLLAGVLVFVLLFGLCVGSFLNVVAYRLPLGRSLVHPPSACPRCNTRLAWYDNMPVLGWLLLGGKCRYCKLPISPRYAIVEAATGALFLGYAAALFVFHLGPCVPSAAPAFSITGLPVPPEGLDVSRHWPVLVLHLALLGMLMAASLIDLDTFTIPTSLPLFAAVVGVAGHGLLMTPEVPGNLFVSSSLALPALGAALGYVVSVVLYQMGVLPVSFPQGEPMLLDHAEWEAEIAAAKAENRPPEVPETPPVHWTRGMLAREMFKELAFILPPLAGFVVALVMSRHTAFGADLSARLAGLPVLPGVLGAVLAGLAGGAAVWFFRIGGTFAFGKLAMGLGDVHLMAAVGAVTGGIVATTALFAGAVWGLVFTLYAFATRSQREFPFGPYLALGTLTTLLLACPLEQSLQNAFAGLVEVLGR